MAGSENDKIKAFENATNNLEQQLETESKFWNEVVTKLAQDLKGDIKYIVEVQAEILSRKQSVVEETRKYSLMLHKASIPIKEIKKTRFEFYSTTYQIQVKNDTTKKGLIESDLARIQYKSDLISNHIIFLQNTANDMDSLNYAVKNRIDLLNILGMS